MKKKTAIIILIIFGITIYFGSLFNQFLWDDEESFVSNKATLSIRNIPNFFLGRETNASGIIVHSTEYYRPVMAVFYTLINTISGGRPFSFRLFQVGIHLLNACLVFFILSQFFKRSKYTPFFLALLFLVHPANSEAVLFMSATQEVLFFFFGATAFYLLIKDKSINLSMLVLVGFLLEMSLLTKETGVVFFVVLFLYLLLFNRKETIRYAVLAALFLYLYFFARISIPGMLPQKKSLYPIMNASLYVRLMTVPRIVLYYLTKFFFPLKLAISQHWLVTKPDVTGFFLPLFIDTIFFISAFIFTILKKNKIFIFFLGWFMVGLLPHLQIIPLNMTAAERWIYFTSVGLLGILGVIISKIEEKYPQLLIIFSFIVIFLFSVKTLDRSFYWKNGLTLFTNDIKLSQNNFELESNLGAELFRTGRIDAAKIHFENSVRLAPTWWINWNNLGAVYASKKDYKKAEIFYKKAMSNADYFLAYENYIQILIIQKKYSQARQFIETDGFKKFPNNKKINNFYKFLLTKTK